jgi:PAT family beta-lactamase induction signal transducer AmpG
LFVPSLYFQQGLPVIIVQQASVVFYKNMGVPNDRIGLLTSLIAWPWILKMLWAPALELFRTRRFWVLSMQILVALSLGAAAWFAGTSHFLWGTLAAFVVAAFASATHDNALDGWYLLALKPSKQAFFIGVSTSSFRLAMLFANGILVMLAGKWAAKSGSVPDGWRSSLLLGTAIYAALAVYAWFAMPKVAADRPSRTESTSARTEFVAALTSFFRRKDALAVIAFVLFYRFSESMVSKMMGPFYLDPRSKGGLGLSTVQVGVIMGQVGMLSLTVGGFLGGVIISRVGLRRLLWPMAIAMHLPIVLYVWAAYRQPSPAWVYLITAVDQFGYGFGMAAYTFVVMQVARASRYSTSHFAIGTAIMSAGAMMAGISSGYLQVALGYPRFFVVVLLCALPGLATLPFVLRADRRAKDEAEAVSATEAYAAEASLA